MKNIEREVGVIYAYPPLKSEPGMAWIETAIHELLEELEDERDKPAITGINMLVKCLDDLTVTILNDNGSSPQLVKLAISKRREVSKLLPKLAEDIYQAREKVVEALTPTQFRKTIISDADLLERGRQLYNYIYKRKLNVVERVLELRRLRKWQKISLEWYLFENPRLKWRVPIQEQEIIERQHEGLRIPLRKGRPPKGWLK